MVVVHNMESNDELEALVPKQTFPRSIGGVSFLVQLFFCPCHSAHHWPLALSRVFGLKQPWRTFMMDPNLSEDVKHELRRLPNILSPEQLAALPSLAALAASLQNAGSTNRPELAYATPTPSPQRDLQVRLSWIQLAMFLT